MNKTLIASIVIILCFIFIGTIVFWQNSQTNKDELMPEIEVSERGEKFKVAKRIPEGTQSGWVDADKVVRGPLDKISIIFNHDVDKTTLTLSNFYALWGIDDKVSSTIEYNKSNRAASLIFDDGIMVNERSSQLIRITVIVRGVKDLKGNKIEELLYNIDIVE